MGRGRSGRNPNYHRPRRPHDDSRRTTRVEPGGTPPRMPRRNSYNLSAEKRITPRRLFPHYLYFEMACLYVVVILDAKFSRTGGFAGKHPTVVTTETKFGARDARCTPHAGRRL